MHILKGYDDTQLAGYSNFSVLEQGTINLLVVWSWQLGFNFGGYGVNIIQKSAEPNTSDMFVLLSLKL